MARRAGGRTDVIMTALRRRSETYKIYRLCRCIEELPGACRCSAIYGTNRACFVVYFPRCSVAENRLPNAALAWKPTTNNKASSIIAALLLVDHHTLGSRFALPQIRRLFFAAATDCSTHLQPIIPARAMSTANVAVPRERRKVSSSTRDAGGEATKLRSRDGEKPRSKDAGREKDKERKDDAARLHKLALKGSGKLVSEFVSAGLFPSGGAMRWSIMEQRQEEASELSGQTWTRRACEESVLPDTRQSAHSTKGSPKEEA